MLICFAAGFLRLFGTFECFSSLLPKIAPTHNYAVFLSFVFFIVLGVIHVFDIISAHIIYYHRWEYVHYAAAALLSIAFLGAFVLMRPFRMMPKIPLYGIDGLGIILWSIFILSLIFAAQYGNQLDWFHSSYIRAAIGAAFISLAFNVGRMTYIRHPFLEFAAFKTKNLVNLLILFLFMGILLSTKNVLQNTFTGAALHLGQLNAISLKWFEFFGMFGGAVFSWYALTRLKWPHKLLTFCGMALIVLYIVMMSFLMSAHTNIEKLYLPLFCCGFGHIVIFITLTVYAQATAPFKNYFQVLCILGLIRTGIASPIGDAIYSHAIKSLLSKHLAAASYGVNIPALADIGSEALIATLRELFAWSAVFGIFVLILISLSHFKSNVKNILPSLRAVYTALKKDA
jgi:hypothetical protein